MKQINSVTGAILLSLLIGLVVYLYIFSPNGKQEYEQTIIPKTSTKVVKLTITPVLTPDDQGTVVGALQSLILIAPEDCVEQCFWNFDLTSSDLEDFKKLIFHVYQTSGENLPSAESVISGYNLNGITIQANEGYRENNLGQSVTDIVLRIHLNTLSPSTLDYEYFLPSSIIDAYGIPDRAYFLYSSENPRTADKYRLELVYENNLMVYVVDGVLSNDQICLVNEYIETIAVHRFSEIELLNGDLLVIGSINGETALVLPPTFTERTNKNLEYFEEIANNPNETCFNIVN